MDLLDFQLEGAAWLASRKLALLADEMRLGKSPQSIRAIDSVAGISRVLIVCPAVARINWAREFEEWSVFPREVQPLLSYSDAPAAPIVTCSFEYATKHTERLKARGPWDVLIIDEVHFGKSVDARRTHALFGRNGLVRAAERVWALSGTPAPNHAGELWVLLYTFGVTPLAYVDFVNRYCDTRHNGYEHQIVGTKKAMIPELRTMLEVVMLRRTMREVMPSNPEPIYASYVVEPGSVEGLIDLTAELEEKLSRERNILSDVVDSAALSDDAKLRMLEGLAGSVSTLRRYTGLQKVAPCVELVSGELELKLYDKIIIFAVHKSVVSALASALSRFGVVTLTGDSTPTQKQAAQDRFNTDPAVRVFIGNIISAGTNITLAAAHDGIFIEQDWVPGNNAQAAKRCSHILKKGQISWRFLALANPIDERVSRAVLKKTKELTEIFDVH